MVGNFLEIGGYFELERFCGSPYHRNAIALNCARNCLAYLVLLRGFRTMHVPDFMCGSVPALLRREGVAVRTYPIDEDLLPDYRSLDIVEGEWLLLMDYYGRLTRADVDRAAERSGGHLVVDETQGFFRKPWACADTFYTCRKWFGVPDGAYLATGDGAVLDVEFPAFEVRDRMGYLMGRWERPALEFFEERQRCEEEFADEPVMAMSRITENIMRAIDYESVIARRDGNYRMLDELLGSLNSLDPGCAAGAFMYPLYLGCDAQDTRKRLAEEGVFVPVLWPENLGLPEKSWAWQYASGVLPLPVDQRYGEDEMRYMAKKVEECLH